MLLRQSLQCLYLAAFLFAPSFAVAGEEQGKLLRVFILAGQSNMEGKGAIKHLEQLLANAETAAQYKHLRDGGEWAKRDDVRIKFLDRTGPLTVGYGKPTNRIGPELQFGFAVGDALKEPVLIIKVAWGGRSLAVDFRPPSAGPGKYTRRDKQTKKLIPLPAESYGRSYREMIGEIHNTLAHVSDYVSDNEGQRFELSGFVWFQGFNDIINAGYMAEYEENLAKFVRDVRKDLGVADLPVVIGELGQQGVEPEKRYAEKHFRFRAMQEAIAKKPEFSKTVRFVKTSPYVTKDGDRFDGGYHYFGRADTFFSIGDAFAKAALSMVPKSPVDHSVTVRKAWNKVQQRQKANKK